VRERRDDQRADELGKGTTTITEEHATTQNVRRESVGFKKMPEAMAHWL
jgi:hypothetical protein